VRVNTRVTALTRLLTVADVIESIHLRESSLSNRNWFVSYSTDVDEYGSPRFTACGTYIALGKLTFDHQPL